jgi:hypothetical protein
MKQMPLTNYDVMGPVVILIFSIKRIGMIKEKFFCFTENIERKGGSRKANLMLLQVLMSFIC